jgi:hypothetical protein
MTMNATDRDDFEQFARRLVAADAAKPRPAPPAATVEARVVMTTDADPLERT